MRSLALLLLFLNMTFFFWQQSWLLQLPWQPEQFKPIRATTLPLQVNLPTLQLKHELPPIKIQPEVLREIPNETETQTTIVETPAAILPEVTTKTNLSGSDEPTIQVKENQISQKVEKIEVSTKPQENATGTCVKIGPYTQETTAKAHKVWLHKTYKIAEVNIEQQEIPIVTKTRVYLTGFKHRQEAKLIQQKLIQQGITDHAIFTTGELKNAISLGIYSNPSNAEKRAKQLKEVGYNQVKLKKQLKNDTRYWLNAKIPNNYKQVLNTFEKTFGTVSFEEIACESVL